MVGKAGKWRNNQIPHHDNMPCHTSDMVQHFLLKNQIPPSPQPLHSQDLLHVTSDSAPRPKMELKVTICLLGNSTECNNRSHSPTTRGLKKGCFQEWNDCWSRLVYGEVRSFECDQVRLLYIYPFYSEKKKPQVLVTFLLSHTSYFNAGSFRYLLYEDARTCSYQTDKNIQTCDAGTNVSLSS